MQNRQREIRVFTHIECEQEEWFSRISEAARYRNVNEKYEFGEHLGYGKFSNVFQARNTVTKEVVAVKVILKESLRAIE